MCTKPFTISPFLAPLTILASLLGVARMATRSCTTFHCSGTISDSSRSKYRGEMRGLPLKARLTQPMSGPAPSIFWYLTRSPCLSTCSMRAPVPSRSGYSADFVSTPFRTMMPPVFSPPTTTQTLPESSGHSSGSGVRRLLGGTPLGAFRSLSAISCCWDGSMRYCMRTFFSTTTGWAFISGVKAFRLAWTPFRVPSNPYLGMTSNCTIWQHSALACSFFMSSLPALRNSAQIFRWKSSPM
mmetsp:Transcript_11316/g.35992  ORF Transcript_11316/g.35992 Transcript_11316/m.35992 type:complete len:241 (-) Transcript_11316:147-869(-)